jgi:hypothetical protein
MSNTLNFQQIENKVMVYIARNINKMCNFTELYNYIIDDENIKNPKVLSEFKNKLYLVMSNLDSKFNDVTVVKHNNNYLVGYNISNKDTKYTKDTNILFKDLDKSVFEYITDNDIDYKLNPDCNKETLLYYGVQTNDINRVKKLLTKYSLSFYSKNIEGKMPLDYLEPNSAYNKEFLLFVKLCLKENNTELCLLKEKNIELNNTILNLLNKITHINNKLSLQNNVNDRFVTIFMTFIFIFSILLYLK